MEKVNMYLLHVQREKQIILTHTKLQKMEWCNHLMPFSILRMAYSPIHHQYVQIRLAVYISLLGWKQSICQEYIVTADGTMAQKCSSSNNAIRRGSKKLCKGSGVMPDFAQVYGFIGSLFDNSASDHLQRLKNMDPINLQAVLTLMKNLSINLASPEFEYHRRLLSSYQVSTGTHYMGSTIEFE